MPTLNEKLKALRNRSGLSIRDMAGELGMSHTTYAAKEDPAKFKKRLLPLDLAVQIADVLERYGVDRKEVLQLAGLSDPMSPGIGRPVENWLLVRGAVEAGVWKEQTDWPESEHYWVKFGPSEYPSEERFAVRMEGTSMNRTILPGSDLECLYVRFSPIPPKPGDIVIVERKRHDLVELTCKRLALIDDEYVLVCESNDPQFQEPIKIGKPDIEDHTDNEVRIVGIVLSAKLDLAPAGLSERRKRSFEAC